MFAARMIKSYNLTAIRIQRGCVVRIFRLAWQAGEIKIAGVEEYSVSDGRETFERDLRPTDRAWRLWAPTALRHARRLLASPCESERFARRSYIAAGIRGFDAAPPNQRAELPAGYESAIVYRHRLGSDPHGRSGLRSPARG